MICYIFLEGGIYMTIGKQIKYYRKEAGLTQKELAERLDVSPNTIQQYELGKRQPRLEMINRIAGALGIGIRRLYPDFTMDQWKKTETYKDVQLEKKLYPNQFSILSHFDKLNASGQNEAIKRVEELTQITKYIVPEDLYNLPEDKIIVLPYFRAGVSAGSGIFILGNEAEDEIELPDLPEYEAADFAIDINGDSMEPDFSHDDIVLVQQDAELFPGDIGVFVVNSNAFIKELGRNELISRNKDYKNIPIHEGDNVVCMGKVIGKVMY